MVRGGWLILFILAFASFSASPQAHPVPPLVLQDPSGDVEILTLPGGVAGSTDAVDLLEVVIASDARHLRIDLSFKGGTPGPTDYSLRSCSLDWDHPAEGGERYWYRIGWEADSPAHASVWIHAPQYRRLVAETGATYEGDSLSLTVPLTVAPEFPVEPGRVSEAFRPIAGQCRGANGAAPDVESVDRIVPGVASYRLPLPGPGPRVWWGPVDARVMGRLSPLFHDPMYPLPHRAPIPEGRPGLVPIWVANDMVERTVQVRVDAPPDVAVQAPAGFKLPPGATRWFPVVVEGALEEEDVFSVHLTDGTRWVQGLNVTLGPVPSQMDQTRFFFHTDVSEGSVPLFTAPYEFALTQDEEEDGWNDEPVRSALPNELRLVGLLPPLPYELVWPANATGSVRLVGEGHPLAESAVELRINGLVSGTVVHRDIPLKPGPADSALERYAVHRFLAWEPIQMELRLDRQWDEAAPEIHLDPNGSWLEAPLQARAASVTGSFRELYPVLGSAEPPELLLAPGDRRVHQMFLANDGAVAGVVALALEHDVPAGLDVDFLPGDAFHLAPGEMTSVAVSVQANESVRPTILDLVATAGAARSIHRLDIGPAPDDVVPGSGNYEPPSYQKEPWQPAPGVTPPFWLPLAYVCLGLLLLGTSLVLHVRRTHRG